MTGLSLLSAWEIAILSDRLTSFRSRRTGGEARARGGACPAGAGDARCDCPGERKALQFRVRSFALLPWPPASGRASSSGAGVAAAAANLNAVRETMEKSLLEISRILNTGLDMETLSICVRLCEQGINPEALSSVIKELLKAAAALKAAENMTS
ncbi:mitotic-spindle organizing protein 1-like [Physeter macrocephalus]|uniref:Mitotic-spindle organizing protein 1-like n=1 Tax=Physeter macrocephalus TaxID=9755 RepID=A0A9W2W7V2_PHYMC|nr:mitotic-spindle organizing protein 1-like [Physeter catodon]